MVRYLALVLLIVAVAFCEPTSASPYKDVKNYVGDNNVTKIFRI